MARNCTNLNKNLFNFCSKSRNCTNLNKNLFNFCSKSILKKL